MTLYKLHRRLKMIGLVATALAIAVATPSIAMPSASADPRCLNDDPWYTYLLCGR